MATVYQHHRVVALGSIPEPDPNTVTPVKALIFLLEKRVRGGDKLTEGHSLFFEFLDSAGAPVSGPTIEWRTWLRDDHSQVWASMDPCSGAGLYEAFVTEDVRNADLYVQLLAVTGPLTTATVVVRVAEV